MSNYNPQETLREVSERRMQLIAQYESEKLFEYNIEDYDNWAGEWYEDEDPGFECAACFGTGLDRHEEADCLECWGEGRVYGTV